jgi:hypothetical protein
MYIFVYMYLLLLWLYNEYRSTDRKISKFFLQSLFNEVKFLRPCSSVGVDIISYNLNNLILSTFAKLRKATLRFFISVQPALCLSAWNNFAPTGRIFIKFDIRGYFQSLSRISKFRENLTGRVGTLH